MGTFANTPEWSRLKDEWAKSGAPPTPFGVFGGYKEAMPQENYAVNFGNGGDNTSGGSGTRGTGANGGGDGTNAGTQSNNSNHATAIRGGGGGGTGASTGTFYTGSNGGSGVVIIRYQL